MPAIRSRTRSQDRPHSTSFHQQRLQAELREVRQARQQQLRSAFNRRFGPAGRTDSVVRDHIELGRIGQALAQGWDLESDNPNSRARVLDLLRRAERDAQERSDLFQDMWAGLMSIGLE